MNISNTFISPEIKNLSVLAGISRKVDLNSISITYDRWLRALKSEKAMLMDILGGGHSRVMYIEAKIQYISNLLNLLTLYITKENQDIVKGTENSSIINGLVYNLSTIRGVSSLTVGLHNEKGEECVKLGKVTTDSNGSFSLELKEEELKKYEDQKLYLYVTDSKNNVLYKDTKPLAYSPGKTEYRELGIKQEIGAGSSFMPIGLEREDLKKMFEAGNISVEGSDIRTRDVDAGVVEKVKNGKLEKETGVEKEKKKAVDKKVVNKAGDKVKNEKIKKKAKEVVKTAVKEEIKKAGKAKVGKETKAKVKKTTTTKARKDKKKKADKVVKQEPEKDQGDVTIIKEGPGKTDKE